MRMDETTSALDYETERQLCLNLQSWAKIEQYFRAHGFRQFRL